MRPLLTAVCAAALATGASAQDWPRYLGPGGEAKVSGEIRTNWGEQAPEELWRKDLGHGCTSFAIADGKVVVMGNKNDEDIVWCFEAASGDELWSYKYPEKLAPKLYDGGPNATPTIDGEVVYTLSRTGNLFCLSMKDGQPVWHKHYQTDFGGKAPDWGYSASPVLHNDQLICLPCAKDGAIFALDKTSGEVRWKSGDSTRPGYAAPVFFEYKGKDAMAAFHGRQLVVYDVGKQGEPLFDFTWRTSYDINASNPQFLDDKMFLASGYGMGYVVIDVAGGEPKVLHKEPDTRMIFQNSILVEGDIVGVFGDKNLDAEVIRMDLVSGKIRWREQLPGSRGSSLMVGDTLVALLETGHIVCGTPGKDGWTEHGRIKPLDRLCWAPVAYADGMIFARSNKGQAVCLKVK